MSGGITSALQRDGNKELTRRPGGHERSPDTPLRTLYRPPDEVKLYHMPNETPLEDARSVSDHRIETDAVLAISFKIPGAPPR